LKIILKRATSL